MTSIKTRIDYLYADRRDYFGVFAPLRFPVLKVTAKSLWVHPWYRDQLLDERWTDRCERDDSPEPLRVFDEGARS